MLLRARIQPFNRHSGDDYHLWSAFKRKTFEERKSHLCEQVIVPSCHSPD